MELTLLKHDFDERLFITTGFAASACRFYKTGSMIIDVRIPSYKPHEDPALSQWYFRTHFVFASE